MLFASFFIVALLVLFLIEYPLGLLFILALTLFPGLVFLYLSCIRAGLVALKASGPPNVKKLAVGTIRMFRFNIMLNNLIVTLVGLGGAIGLIMVMTPDVWVQINESADIRSAKAISVFLEKLSMIPIMALLMPMVALSLSNGLVGTSSASVAASAADIGPSHPALWGLARKFLPLFTLSLLVLVLPTALLVYALGGFQADLSDMANLDLPNIVFVSLYLVWAGCAVCAGKALAYAEAVKDMELEFQKERDDMMGEIVPEDNLRELRLKRQEAARLEN